MISRDSKVVLQKYAVQFPVVVLTGARQVGKTTLLKENFPHHRYVLLEDPDTRSQALEDPRTFLSRYPSPVIFDEFQYVPELTSYLQGIVDTRRKEMGQFILTGSQNFLMMEQVTQSLAGRAGLLSLYGLNTSEIPLPDFSGEANILSLLFRGTFPELWARPELDPKIWFGSYLRTYLERDVRNLTQVGNLASFERFIRLCAIRTGQLLNLSELARDCGISPPTAQRWLSLLIETYQVHLVEPFYENLSSRIKKSPKLYFLDVGLAAYLMGFRDISTLIGAPQFGSLFETLVITNFVKKRASQGEVPEHYFLQTKTGLEVDLIVRNQTRWDLYEVKYRRTLGAGDLHQLLSAQKLMAGKINRLHLLAPVGEAFDMKGVAIGPWTEI